MYVCLELHAEIPTALLKRLYAWHNDPANAGNSNKLYWNDRTVMPNRLRTSYFIPSELIQEINAATNLRFEPSDV